MIFKSITEIKILQLFLAMLHLQTPDFIGPLIGHEYATQPSELQTLISSTQCKNDLSLIFLLALEFYLLQIALHIYVWPQNAIYCRQHHILGPRRGVLRFGFGRESSLPFELRNHYPCIRAILAEKGTHL